jgi:hypothetical protein
MRLGIRILNSDATLNNHYELERLSIYKGETATLVVQLWDEEKGIRYIPAAGATLYVEISRFPEYFGDVNNTRTTRDYSVRQNATQPFSDDKSIWSLPLPASATANMTSSAVRFTLTEGASVRIATVQQAIEAVHSEEA